MKASRQDNRRLNRHIIAKEKINMKSLRTILCSGLLLLILSGCASINYNDIASNANTFQPKVAVILPAIKMPEGTEQDIDKVAKAIFDAAVATKRFERIIDPTTAKSQMSDNGDLQSAVMTYTAKLRSLAVSDKDNALKIGEILQADTIIVGEVSKWGYGIYAGEKNGGQRRGPSDPGHGNSFALFRVKSNLLKQAKPPPDLSSS
jgi:hypothetical protein